MACYHPLDGKLSPSGKFISRNSANYGQFTRLIKLPCGRCIGCKLERSNQWALRLMHEAQLHKESCFATLTLSDEYLATRHCRGTYGSPGPLPSDASASDNTLINHAHAEARAHEDSLDRPLAQLFTKRLYENSLRTRGLRVRYYLIGEYGERTNRPHYHIAIFGDAFTDDRREWRTTDQGHTVWRSSRLEALWPHGNSELAELTLDSAAYIARYCVKKITGDKADEHYRRTAPDGSSYWLEPEFAHMSRRPGIGKDWIARYMTDVYPHDYVIHRGEKKKPPRYYDEQLKKLEAYELALGGRSTIQTIKTRRDELRLEAEKTGETTPERLRVKELVQNARLAFKKRNLE